MADKVVPYEVLAAFCRDPAGCAAKPLGGGNINETYLIRSAACSFVLQKINDEVFPNPLKVIENFQIITDHLRRKKDSVGCALKMARPVLTLERDLFYRDGNGAFWRGQSYLPHASYSVLAHPDQARPVGEVLATFHRLVADLDVEVFHDPLPGFHDLSGYLAEFDRSMEMREIVEDEAIRFCLKTIERYRMRAGTLQQATHAGILTRQPIHGDPKVDNFLFGQGGEVLGLLDLDTVAMGLVQHDLGDCLRSCCNRVGETGRERRPVAFDLDFCRSLLDGYFSRAEQRLATASCGYIFDGALLICFELGVRFFTDYLRGNRYFKVVQAGDNLAKAVIQFQLTDDIARQEQEIRDIVMSSGQR